MIGALALLAITVQPGQTLSGIASAHGLSLSAIESDNPQIGNPDLIYVGENVKVTGGSSWSPTPSSPASSGPSSSSSSQGQSSGGSGSTSSGGYHIPGVSDATTACIAMRESTNGAGSPNVFQISNYYPGESLSAQEAAAGQIAATQGVANAWGAYDGC